MEPPMLEPMGEWPGAVSAKFSNAHTGKPAGRRIVDTGCRNGPGHSLAHMGLGGYAADTAGLAASQGKRCTGFAPQGGEVCEWRPARRALSEPGCMHLEKPEGRRHTQALPRKIVSLREKRHIRQVGNGEEFSDRPSGIQTVVRPNGLRAHDQPAREVDLSAEFQRKNRPLDLVSQRNGLGCRTLGDKCYKHPEYDNSFYQAGGLVAGSSFIRGTYKRSEPRNATTLELVVPEDRKPLKSYAEAQREMELEEAQDEVKALTRNWEVGTLKECDETYEPPSDSEDEAPVAQEQAS